MNKKITKIARKLRKNSTKTEEYLWRYLKNRYIEGFKFRKQEPIRQYVIDFVNFEKKIIVELDGGQHIIMKAKDHERDRWLKKQGFKVLRFWDNEVLKNIEGVLETIRRELLSPHPDPLPQRGEGETENRNEGRY